MFPPLSYDLISYISATMKLLSPLPKPLNMGKLTFSVPILDQAQLVVCAESARENRSRVRSKPVGSLLKEKTCFMEGVGLGVCKVQVSLQKSKYT